MPSSIVNEVETSIPVAPITLEDLDFTLEDVQSILYNVIGESPTGLAKTLFLKFRSELDQGEITNEWKNLTVFPIVTKGGEWSCAESMSSYEVNEEPMLSKCRPISHTSVDFKVFERILTNKIIDHLEINHLLSKHHYGLHFNQSYLTDDLDDFEEDYPSDAIYLNWKDAFETIPHNHLITKLKEYGISGKVLNWIEGYLKDQTRRVKFDDELSEPLLITSGVLRESILGRILFLLYINDMFEGIQSGGKIHADYCTLYRSIKSPRDRDILQQDLLNVRKWCSKWSIQLYKSRCHVQNIGMSNPKYDYYIHKLQLEKMIKDREFNSDYTPADCRSSDHNTIAREPINDRNSDVADKTNFSNLCKIYDHVFAKDTKFPVFATDPKMNIKVTDLVSFGDLEDAARVSQEKIPVGGTIIGTIHTVRQFEPGVYRCTRVIPFEDHEPVFIYHHESIDPAKIIRQSYLIWDINDYHQNEINSINRYDWTRDSAGGCGVLSEESEDDEYDEERMTKWLKKKRIGKDEELYQERKSYMYFANYENASCLKKCVKNECIVYSDISSTHYTVVSPELNIPIAMASEIVCSIEPWKMGKAFQDISSQKYFALMIYSYNFFMYILGVYRIKDSFSRLKNKYPNMQFTTIKETELKFNMADFTF